MENPHPFSEEVSSAPHLPIKKKKKRLRNVLRPPLSVKRLLRQQVENKRLGLNAQKNVVVYSMVHRRLLCNKPKEEKKDRRRCRKLQIRNHYAATNMTGTVLHIIWAPTITHSVSLPMSVNNASRVCIVLQSRRLFLWIGAKLQKRPLQIRHDGFIIRLKCQLLQKPIPRLHSADRSFELPIIPAKPKQSPFCKTLAPTLRNTHDQCWLSCWQQRVTGLIYAFITRFIQGTQRPYLIAKKGLSLSLSFLNCCFLI